MGFGKEINVQKMLRADAFEFEHGEAAWLSVQQMKQGKADFSDYLINQIIQEAGCSETVTFDSKLKGCSGIRLL